MDAPEHKLSAAAPVVVLGAGGFIGQALTARLAATGIAFRPLTRADTGTLNAKTDWPRLLEGAQSVVHLASRAHAPAGDLAWIDEETDAAAALAQAARRCGAARVIFLSSIKAIGAESDAGCFDASTEPHPSDAYGRAKLALEAALADAPGLAILRPPLVYGPGVKANFRALLGLAARGLPLPFASITNRRSLIFIENLVDVIATLLRPDAPAGVYLVRDGEDVSTPELVRHLAQHLGRRTPLLWPCPPALLRAALTLSGRGDAAAALIGSLAVDDSATRARLGWQPRFSLDDGLAATCRWFRNERA